MFNPQIFTRWRAIQIIQNSDLWRLWRNSGIGASEAATIMGMNKFDGDIETLWKIKKGWIIPEQLTSEEVLNGIALEPVARQEFIKLTDEYVEPMCGMHPEYDFLKVSLDGISEDGGLILEIKCPFRFFTHYHNRNKIPSYYYAQIQHQLFVTGADVACFYSYTKGGGYMQEVYPDRKFINELFRRQVKFWYAVKKQSSIDPNDFLPYADYSDSEELIKKNKGAQKDINADDLYKALTAKAATKTYPQYAYKKAAV